MRKNNLLWLFATLLFINCTPAEDETASEEVDPNPIEEENNEEPTEPEGGEKRYVSKVTQPDGTWEMVLHYEDGLLKKGVYGDGLDAEGYDTYNTYYGAFQLEYNDNNRVARMQFVPFWADLNRPSNFYFDLNTYDDDKVMLLEFHYSGDLLDFVEVEGERSGKITFSYDDQGNLIENIADYGDEIYKFRVTYNDSGKLVEGWSSWEEIANLDGYDESYESSVELVTDDKINPFYFLWKDHSFFLPPVVDGFFYNENLFFSPHNIVAHLGEDLGVRNEIEYDGDYPVYMNQEVYQDDYVWTEEMFFYYLEE